MIERIFVHIVLCVVTYLAAFALYCGIANAAWSFTAVFVMGALYADLCNCWPKPERPEKKERDLAALFVFALANPLCWIGLTLVTALIILVQKLR